MAAATATAAAAPVLKWPGMQPELLAVLQSELVGREHSHPFPGVQEVEVFRHPEGLVFALDDGKTGFSFTRSSPREHENEIAIFRRCVRDRAERQYLTVAYEVSEDPTVVSHVLANFEARYDQRHVGKLDSLLATPVHVRSLKHPLLMVRLPKEMVYEMMSAHGGQFMTTVRGPVAAMRTIPSLAKLVPAEDASTGSGSDTDKVRRAIVSEYKAGERDLSRALHWAVVADVLKHPNRGICVGPVATWSS